MRRILGGLAIGAMALAVGGAAWAEAAHKADPMHTMVMIKDDDAVTYQPAFPTLPKGMDIAVLAGDPAKVGKPFALRVKVPADFVIPPHSHPTPETLTVIDGDVWHALGKTVDKTKGDELEEGGFAFVPAHTTHYLWTKKETVLQVNGIGPFKVLWTNPADDPKNQK